MEREWLLDALCTENPALWFPDSRKKAEIDAAADRCLDCPVFVQCREWALKEWPVIPEPKGSKGSKDGYGGISNVYVIAGMTPRELIAERERLGMPAVVGKLFPEILKEEQERIKADKARRIAEEKRTRPNMDEITHIRSSAVWSAKDMTIKRSGRPRKGGVNTNSFADEYNCDEVAD